MVSKFELAAAAALTSFGVLALIGNARAHATFENSDVAPARSQKAVLRVPHGCNGEATHTVRITIPEGIVGVKPMPKAGWELTTQDAAYERPYTLWGKPVARGVREIVWSKGHLPDAHYDEFAFQYVVAADQTAAQLPVPVVQECAAGRVAWVETAAAGQDPHALKFPAPVLRVQLAQAANPHAGHAMQAPAAMPASRSYTAGPMKIESVWTRATPGGARVGGGFMTITNTGKDVDRLVKFETDVAERGEVHEMATTNGVMTMREIKALDIRPGETVTLKPGSFHVMFMGLKNPIVPTTVVKGTLTFEKAGRVDVEFAVAPIGAAGPGGAGANTGHKH